MKSLAIVILNWNGKKWLEQFLPSVIAHSANAEVFVIDNASEDDSVSFLASDFPEVKVIQNAKNHGFAGGYNEGLKQINADIYCLLNSDVEVTPGWLEPVLDVFEHHPEVAAVQPKILDYNRRTHFEFAGAGGGMMDNLGYPWCRGRIFDRLEQDLGQYDDVAEIFWASGCSLFIQSADFWKENGFDERFFAHQEEIDLCWRLKNSGRKIFYTGQSAVYHAGGGTLNKQNPQKTYLNFRNNLTMLLKNLPFPKLLWLIFFRLCLDGVAGIYFGITQGFGHLWAVVRSHFGFYGMIPGTLKRRIHQPIKKYHQQKWLIFKHYLSR